MLISFGNGSQFGNLYLASAHRVAHAVKYRYSLFLCDLGRHKSFLERPDPAFSIRYGGSAMFQFGRFGTEVMRKLSVPNRISCGLFYLHRDSKTVKSITSEELVANAKGAIVVHRGLKFRDLDVLREQADTVRRILKFRDTLRTPVVKRFEELRRDYETIIGVHVRRGDYKAFRNGMFYFEDETYLRIAEEAAKNMERDGRRVLVLGFSNEPLKWPSALGRTRVDVPVGSWHVDLLSMSMCDLLIGPPSTFSGSASFLADVPWFQIKDKEASFDEALAIPYLESGIRP